MTFAPPPPLRGNGPVSLPLDRATVALSWMMVTLKTAFMAGSSKQGKVFLACVACICEVATTLRARTQVTGTHRRRGLGSSHLPPHAVLGVLAPVEALQVVGQLTPELGVESV